MRFNWLAVQLVIVCVAVFVLQNIYPSIEDQFALVTDTFSSNPWIIITSIFLHGSVAHLFYNMFALGLFGSVLEGIIGGRKFLLVFFVAGIISGIASLLFYDASIGASGAIYGIFGVLAILRPKMTVAVSYVPMPMIVAVILWAAGDLLGFFAPCSILSVTAACDNIAYASHLFGLVSGIVIGIFLRGQHKKEKDNIKELKVDEEKMREWEDKWMSSNSNL